MNLWLVGSAATAWAGEPLCAWPDVVWEQVATLRLPDGAPFASAGSSGAPVADAALEPDGRLRLALRGEGVTVEGVVDLDEDPVLHLTVATPLGPATAVRGALVSTGGAAPGGVEVGAHPWALEAQRPRRLPTAVVPCASLSPTHRWTLGTDAEWLRLAGLPPAVSTGWLGPGAVALRDADGRRLLRWRVGRAGQAVSVLSADPERVEVAFAHWTGVVWHAFVRPGDVGEAPPPRAPGDASVLGDLGGDGRTLELRRCDTPLTLSAEVGGRREVVGTVDAGVGFEVLAQVEGAVSVDFPQGFLHPAQGARLLLPPAAAACPAEPFRVPGLSELLEGLL